MENDERAEQAVAVVARHYEYSNEGDWAKVERQFARDVVLVEADGHPCPGTWRGIEALREGGAGVVAALNLISVVPGEMFVAGSRVAALVELQMTDREGERFTHEVVELWTINAAGEITEIRPFYHDLVALRQRLGCDDV